MICNFAKHYREQKVMGNRMGGAYCIYLRAMHAGFLTENPEVKRLLGKTKSSWENIKVYLKRYGMKWCELGIVVRSVNTITNVRVHENKRICFTS